MGFSAGPTCHFASFRITWRRGGDAVQQLGGFLAALVFVLGLTELTRWVRFWLLCPGKEAPMVLEVRLENAASCEYQLRAALERVRWMHMPAARVRCINVPCDPQIEAVILRFAQRYACMEYDRRMR